jgi:excisionase family DNA binding protein
MTVDGAVSAREAARMTGVVERTVRRWIERGRLPAERNADGQFRIAVAALKPFMRGELEPPAPTESAANGIVTAEGPLEGPEPTPAASPLFREANTWMERAIVAETLLELIGQAYGGGEGGQPEVYTAVQFALRVFWRHGRG